MTFAGIFESLRTVNRSKFTEKEASNEQRTKFKTYGIGLQVPHCLDFQMQEEGVNGEIRDHPGEVFHGLARQKESKTLEGHMMSNHLHILISIPPKYSASQVVGFIKGKSAIYAAINFAGRKRSFVDQSFWARGYYVSASGKDEKSVGEYIRSQEKEDRRIDQLSMFK